ncbi:unnamed protein product, partial [marine sediment metagenome]
MGLQSMIDPQFDRGSADNQLFAWNNTTRRAVPTLTPSGLTSIGVNGIGTFRQINIYSPTDDGAAKLIIANAGDTSNYMILQDQSDTIGSISKISAAASVLRFNAIPVNETSTAIIDMFRTTKTSEAVVFKLFRGNGTDTV